MKLFSVLALFIYASVLCLSSFGQVAAIPELGANPYKSYSGGDIDHIELQNGNLYAHMPIVSLPQLGKLGLSFSVNANVPAWSVTADCDPQGDCEVYYINGTPSGPNNCTGGTNVGWSDTIGLVVDQALDYCVALHDQPYTVASMEAGVFNTVDQDWYTYTIIDSTRALHEMGFDSTNTQFLHDNNGLGYSMIIEPAWVSPGSPGLNLPLPTIVEPNGVTHQTAITTDSSGNMVNTTTITDTNGNSISDIENPSLSYHEITDSVGRRIPDPTDPSYLPAASLSQCPDLHLLNEPVVSAFQWQIPGPNGSTNTYILCYTKIWIATNFFGNGPGAITSSQVLCTNPEPGGSDTCWLTEADAAYSEDVLQSVVLPNHTFWGFKYSTTSSSGDTSYGDITDIIYPTGGSLHYDDTTIQACGFPAIGEYWPLQRAVHQRVETPLSGSPITTLYNYQPTSTVVTDADHNDVVHHFTLDYPNLASLGCGAAETSTRWFRGAQSAGVLLREKDIQYSGTPDPQEVIFPGAGEIATSPTIINRRPVSAMTIQDGVVISSNIYSYDTWYADAQPWSEESANPTAFSTMPQNSLIYFSKPATVDDGIHRIVTERYASDHTNYAAANLIELPERITTYSDATSAMVARTTYEYDESGSPVGIRGNQTSAHQWLNTTGSDITTTNVYDSSGRVIDTYDANLNAGMTYGNHIHTTYDAAGLFPAIVQQSTTAGAEHRDYYAYDDVSGFMTSHTDQNGSGADDTAHKTTYSYDSMGRLTSINLPPTVGGHGQTSYCYVDYGQSSSCSGSTENTIYSTALASPNPSISESVSFDGIGRVIERVDGSGAKIDTLFDELGRVQATSNPYLLTSDATYGWTSYTYDALGRRLLQCQADNNSPTSSSCNAGAAYLQWQYNGLTTTEIDESGHRHQQSVDTEGRLVQVLEQNPATTALSLETDYTYNALGDLVSVNQMGNTTSDDSPRTRSFEYDSLSRLLWSLNSESGFVCYGQGDGTAAGCQANGYDPNGNLIYKTDARGVVTNLGYDSLNRLVAKTYNNAPPGTFSSCYQYDGSEPNGFGRLVSSWTQSGTTAAVTTSGSCASTLPATGAQSWRSILEYDPMGRIKKEQQCTPGNCTTTASNPYNIRYDYDLIGNLIHANDGIGQIGWWLQYDGAGRLAGANAYTAWSSAGSPSPLYPSQLFTATGYTASSLLSGWTLGTGPSGVPALTGSRHYDNRLRPTDETVNGHD